MQAAAHGRGSVPAQLRLDTRLLAHRLEQRIGTLRLRRSLHRGGAGVGVGIACDDMGERELPLRRDEQLGERDRVASALPSVHPDNDPLEHPVPLCVRTGQRPDGTSATASISTWISGQTIAVGTRSMAAGSCVRISPCTMAYVLMSSSRVRYWRMLTMSPIE